MMHDERLYHMRAGCFKFTFGGLVLEPDGPGRQVGYCGTTRRRLRVRRALAATREGGLTFHDLRTGWACQPANGLLSRQHTAYQARTTHVWCHCRTASTMPLPLHTSGQAA